MTEFTVSLGFARVAPIETVTLKLSRSMGMPELLIRERNL